MIISHLPIYILMTDKGLIDCPFCVDGHVENTGLPEFDDYRKKTKHELCGGTGLIPKKEVLS